MDMEYFHAALEEFFQRDPSRSSAYVADLSLRALSALLLRAQELRDADLVQLVQDARRRLETELNKGTDIP
jgi:hypothetical protein